MDYGVITICLNAAKTIPMTIESIFAQTRLPRQVIFVDGGSNDGTLEYIQTARETGRALGVNVSCIQQPPPPPGVAGIPNAWNLGLRALDTEVVFIINSDDWYEEHAAATLLDRFADFPEAGVISTPVRFWSPDMTTFRVRHPRSCRWFPVLMPLLHPGCFVRMTVYRDLGFFDERYRISADYDFLYRCHRAGIGIVRTRDIVVNMLMGGTAGRNRAVARRETMEIARRNGCFPLLPYAACLFRQVFGR